MKQTIVHVEDSIGLSDESNLNKPRIRKKAVHEQIFEQYGIDEKELSNSKERVNKSIPREWYKDIIEWNIQYVCKNNPGTVPVHMQQSVDTYTFTFDDKKKTQKFTEGFNRNIFKAINSVIVDKGENPSSYGRTFIVEVKDSDYRLEILIT